MPTLVDIPGHPRERCIASVLERVATALAGWARYRGTVDPTDMAYDSSADARSYRRIAGEGPVAALAAEQAGAGP